MRWSRRDFAASVEVEQLHGHLLDRRAGLVAPRCPPFSAEGVEPRRSDEPTVEDSNRQTCRRDAVVVEQLVETLGLASVVAEDQRGDSIGDNLLEAPDVALDFLRLAERKNEGRIVAGEIDPTVGS